MKTLFVSLCTTLILLTGAFGADVDWKAYGRAAAGDEVSTCFFDAKGVTKVRSDNHLKVWTKCLLRKDIEGVDLQSDLGIKVAKNAAQKMANGYVPPIALTDDISRDQAMGFIAYEEIANIAPLQPLGRIFFELDCDERRLRILSISITAKGKSGSVDKPGEWLNVSPETNGNRLLKILCR